MSNTIIKNKFLLILSIGILLLASNACKKRTFLNNGGSLRFSQDTLTFDTVFTTQGSVTKWVLLHNNNNKWVKVSRINLAKGSASPFRLNVDGQPTKDIANIDIAPLDSAYIFVAITVDPTNADNPFIIEDKLQATLNGTTVEMPLQAYGQNAIYIKDSVIQGNVNWTKNKPYIILNYAFVDSNATLTLEPGTRVYGHANSAIFIKGSLVCNGTKTDSIIFQGDRLDRDYFGGDAPGEWCGLHYLEKSHSNVLSYTSVKNGGAPFYFYDNNGQIIGAITGALIYLEPNNPSFTTPKLIVNNSIIGISSGAGILGFRSSCNVTNSLIYNCAGNNVTLLEGGNYNFIHNSLVNFGYKFYIKHDKESVLGLQNFYQPVRDSSYYVGSNLNANITNCIITGSITDTNEIAVTTKPTWAHTINFTNCLLRYNNTSTYNLSTRATLTNCTNLVNANAGFTDINIQDFTLLNTSIAKAGGIPAGVNIDLKDNARGNPPSIGCYE